jgi:hypothetical protein
MHDERSSRCEQSVPPSSPQTFDMLVLGSNQAHAPSLQVRELVDKARQETGSDQVGAWQPLCLPFREQPLHARRRKLSHASDLCNSAAGRRPCTHLWVHTHSLVQHHPCTCLQVDLLGHSAGGWLARAFIGQEQYKDGMNSSDMDPHPAVRSLITLGTPHTPPPPEKARLAHVALSISLHAGPRGPLPPRPDARISAWRTHVEVKAPAPPPPQPQPPFTTTS